MFEPELHYSMFCVQGLTWDTWRTAIQTPTMEARRTLCGRWRWPPPTTMPTPPTTRNTTTTTSPTITVSRKYTVLIEVLFRLEAVLVELVGTLPKSFWQKKNLNDLAWSVRTKQIKRSFSSKKYPVVFWHYEKNI